MLTLRQCIDDVIAYGETGDLYLIGASPDIAPHLIADFCCPSQLASIWAAAESTWGGELDRWTGSVETAELFGRSATIIRHT